MEEAVDFGGALALLREGRAVARSGWNGKGMFLYLVGPGNYPAATDIAKAVWGADGLVPYGPYIAMKTAQGNVVPWLASQTDVLAEDWQIVTVGAEAPPWQTASQANLDMADRLGRKAPE